MGTIESKTTFGQVSPPWRCRCCCVSENGLNPAQTIEKAVVLPAVSEAGGAQHYRADLAPADCGPGLRAKWSQAMGSSGCHQNDASTSQRFFPIYCLPMPRFSQLQLMQKHEVIFEDLCTPVDDIVHFISHEWLGFHHPDPEGVQLKLLQDVLDTFTKGEAKSLFSPTDWPAFLQGFSTGSGEVVRRFEAQLIARELFDEEDLARHVTDGCVWLDYHSIPQDRTQSTFLDAVNSIPNYVERCDYFWICAPRAQHQDLGEPRDYASWRQRGWCRLEEMTNLMSKRLKMPLVLTSAIMVETYSFLDWVQTLFGRPDKSVANGDFTCCRFHHRIKQPDGSVREIACDKEAIAPIIAQVFESLYAQSQSAADFLKRNVLQHASLSIFAGMEDYLPELIAKFTPPPDETVDAFLARMNYESLDSVDSLGWPPLFCAVSFAHINVVKEMCRLRPNMLYKRPHQGQALMAAAVHRPIEEFKEILSWDPRSRTPKELNHASFRGYTVLDRAAKFGLHEHVRCMLELNAAVDVRRLDNGCTPLLSAAEVGYPKCCQVLLEYRADIQARSSSGDTPLHFAARPTAVIGNSEPGSKTEVIEVLLRGNADLNARDAAGLTPLEVSKQRNFVEGVEALQKGIPTSQLQ